MGQANIPLKKLKLEINDETAFDFSVQAPVKLSNKKKCGMLLLTGTVRPEHYESAGASRPDTAL